MDEAEVKAIYAREIAKGEIQVLDELRNATLTQHTEMFKWLTASLLAINGAAAVSVIGTGAIDGIHKVCAGTNFVVGVFLALTIGVATQILSAKTLRPIQSLKGYWLAVFVDGERLENLENELEDEIRKSAKHAWIIPALGWMSGLFFAIGLAVVAHGILAKEQSNRTSNPTIERS